MTRELTSATTAAGM